MHVRVKCHDVACTLVALVSAQVRVSCVLIMAFGFSRILSMLRKKSFQDSNATKEDQYRLTLLHSNIWQLAKIKSSELLRGARVLYIHIVSASYFIKGKHAARKATDRFECFALKRIS